MTVRSAVLGAGIAPVTVSTTIVTCPAGMTIIVKDVRVYNDSGVAMTVVLWAHRASPAANVALISASLAIAAVTGIVCGVVLGPGDNLFVIPTSGSCRYWASGSVLAGVSPLP